MCFLSVSEKTFDTFSFYLRHRPYHISVDYKSHSGNAANAIKRNKVMPLLDIMWVENQSIIYFIT